MLRSTKATPTVQLLKATRHLDFCIQLQCMSSLGPAQDPDLQPLGVLDCQHAHALVMLAKQNAYPRVASLQRWHHVNNWPRPAAVSPSEMQAITEPSVCSPPQHRMQWRRCYMQSENELTARCPGPWQRSEQQCSGTVSPGFCPNKGSRVAQRVSGRLLGKWKAPAHAWLGLIEIPAELQEACVRS